jgi:hypothetical protein
MFRFRAIDVEKAGNVAKYRQATATSGCNSAGLRADSSPL